MKQANSIGFSSLFSSLAEQAPQRTSHVRVHVPSPAFDPPASSVARAISAAVPQQRRPVDILADASVAAAAAEMYRAAPDDRLLAACGLDPQLGANLDRLEREAAEHLESMKALLAYGVDGLAIDERRLLTEEAKQAAVEEICRDLISSAHHRAGEALAGQPYTKERLQNQTRRVIAWLDGRWAAEQPKPFDADELPPMPRSSYVDEPRPALLEWGRWLLRALATHVDKSAVFDIAARALLDRAKPRENRVHGMVFLATAACWSACAFPQVTITHKLAASLMATDVPAELLPDVPLPWPAFLLVPPDGLLEIDGQPLRAICLIDGHAHMTGLPWLRAGGLLSDHRFSLYAFGSSRVWHGSADSLGELLTEPRAGSRSGGAGTLIEGRVAHMIGRLLVGALVELDAAEHRAAVQRGAPAPKIAKGREPEPRAWVFELRRDVRVDVRAYVRDYIAGTGSGHAPSVQVLVRGHRKRQVCGKGRADRRWIHVEPYWRGPEDAPIALRSHKLTRED